MHFDTKSYLKNNHYHTAKHPLIQVREAIGGRPLIERFGNDVSMISLIIYVINKMNNDGRLLIMMMMINF